MSHDTKNEQQAPTTSSAAERLDVRTPDRKKLSRKQLLGLSAGGVALATAVGIGINFGIHSDNKPEQKVPGTSQPVGETTAPTPEASTSGIPVSSYEALNQNGGEFSAEALSKLSPEQLTALFQIKASELTTIKDGKMPTDPADVTKFGQEYTKILDQRIEAWDNVGCTKAEWAPYQNAGKGVFETAMATKYNTPIAMGVFGYVTKPDALEGSLNRCNVMYMDNKAYYDKIDVVDGSVKATLQSNGTIAIDLKNHYTDNYDVRDVLGDNPDYGPADYMLQWKLTGISINNDGVIIPSGQNPVSIS